MEVALFGEVEDGLADGGQTDAQLIGVLALARELLPLAKLTALDSLEQVRPELGVQRDG